MGSVLNEKRIQQAFSVESWSKKYPHVLSYDYGDFIANPQARAKLKTQTQRGKLLLLSDGYRPVAATMPLKMFLDHQRLAEEGACLYLEYPVQSFKDTELHTNKEKIAYALTQDHKPEGAWLPRPYNILICDGEDLDGENFPKSSQIQVLVNLKYLNRHLESNNTSQCLFCIHLKEDFDRGHLESPPEIDTLLKKRGDSAPAPFFRRDFQNDVYHRLSWPADASQSVLCDLLNRELNNYNNRDRSNWFSQQSPSDHALETTNQPTNKVGQTNHTPTL